MRYDAAMHRSTSARALALLFTLLTSACGGSDGTAPPADAGTLGDAGPVDAPAGDASVGVDGDVPDGASTDAETIDASTSDGGEGGLPAGWLYTESNHVYVSDGAGGGAVWVGRGVNIDDVYLCGYNYTLWDTSAESELTGIVNGLLSGWHPTFVRVSLGMASYPVETSWTENPAEYQEPMTRVINAIGATPGVYVLVALRSHASMIWKDAIHGDAEATGIPSDATTTPDAVRFPTGTDATYVALVNTFASSPFVMFGLTNEPGGNLQTDTLIAAAMQHGVDVIRAEEARLGVPHHLISVQGNDWTSDLTYYATSPLIGDNLVYEIHGYPPTPTAYTYADLPVIIGEYGSLPDSAAFFADIEAKQLPNAAWDFEPFSDCSPDLLTITHSETSLVPTAWGSTVQAYLASHAP